MLGGDAMPLVDFAIIAGLVEEFGELRRLVPELLEDDSSTGTEVWYRGRIQANERTSYSVVAAFQTDMGSQQASALVGKVIERWDPAYIVLVGIAGSFHSDVRLGDVIVGVQVFFIDPGKATEEGIRYRPEGYPCSPTLVRQFQALTLDGRDMDRWRASAAESANSKADDAERRLADEGSKASRSKAEKARLKKKWSDLKILRLHEPRAHFGTMASGSLVVASKTLQERLLSLHGKILGTEMESAGMMIQTFTHEMPTPAIVVKGISDHADPKKSAADGVGYWRKLACENSIRLVLGMLRRGRIKALHTDEFAVDPTCGSIDETRPFVAESAAPGIAIRGFPRLVCPRGPITNMAIDVEAIASDGRAVRIHKQIVVSWGCDADVHTVQDCPPGKTVQLEHLAPKPIQLHLLLAEPATAVRFFVKTAAEQRSSLWQM